MFHVIDVETGTVVRLLRTKQVAEFKTPTRASSYAKKRGVRDGKKYKIKNVVEDTAWIKREEARMRDGTYIHVPFSSHTWFLAALGIYTKGQLSNAGGYENLIPLIGVAKHHFPHVSMANKTMLAYTESPEKGARDIQTQIKPGAYLAKFFGAVLSQSDITSQVDAWNRQYADVELLFARTPKDIVAVYMAGPNSCMSAPAENYSTRDAKNKFHHPCEAYGQPASDLTLAYIKGKNGISARCIVWEDRKKYGRIYGNATLLARELHALGYQDSGYNFNGARIAKIDISRAKGYKTYVMPYIDGYSSVLDNGDHFLLTHDRKPNQKWLCCYNTSGQTATENLPVYICRECDEEIEDPRSYDGDQYCEDCFNEQFIYCDHYNRWAPREGSDEVMVRLGSGRHHPQTWCADAIRMDAMRCPVMERLYALQAGVFLGDGVTWISRQGIAKGGYFLCPRTGKHWPDTEGVEIECPGLRGGETFKQFVHKSAQFDNEAPPAPTLIAPQVNQYDPPVYLRQPPFIEWRPTGIPDWATPVNLESTPPNQTATQSRAVDPFNFRTRR